MAADRVPSPAKEVVALGESPGADPILRSRVDDPYERPQQSESEAHTGGRGQATVCRKSLQAEGDGDWRR